MLIDLTWKNVSVLEAGLLEGGAQRTAWTAYTDARITTDEAPSGVGPVVYLGKPEDPETGVQTYDGVIRDALLLFFDAEICVRAIIEDGNPDDVIETCEDYVNTHGGNVADMQALKPVGT